MSAPCVATHEKQRVSCPKPEEPMTMQVCLVGSDGFVLASDTKMTVDGNGEIRSSTHTSKIEFLPDKGFCCCVAGNQLASVAARIIRKKVKENRFEIGEMQGVLEDAANDAWKECYGTPSPLSYEDIYRNRVIAAMSTTKETRVWKLELIRTFDCLSVKDKVVIGDPQNPSVFLIENFLPKRPVRSEQLKLLAASVIVLGNRYNSNVDGLEMVVAKNGVLEKIEDSEIEALASEVMTVDKSVLRLFFPN
jgi:hypothetical protein